MLSIKLDDSELGNSELTLDLEKRTNNFILGYIQSGYGRDDDDRLNIGFIPNSVIDTIVDIAYSESERLRMDISDILDDRDASETEKEWYECKDKASDIFEEYTKFWVLHAAFDWHDGQDSSFEFWNEDKFLDSDDQFEIVQKRLNEPYFDKEMRDMKPDSDGNYCF